MVGAVIGVMAIWSIPACGGSKSGSTPVPNILVSDDFSGPIPLTNWSVTGTGTMNADSTSGAPAPSLFTGPDASSSTASLAVTTINQFASPSITVSVRMAFSCSKNSLGDGGVVITNVANPAFYADFTRSQYPSPAICTISGSTTNAHQTPVTAGLSQFDLIEFMVDALGNASLSFNGNVIVSQAAFPSGNYQVILRNSSGSFFNFDSVVVTSP